MSETLYDFCQRVGKKSLLEEWDAEKNAPLTPRNIAVYSNKRAWWHCGKGHSWCASVNSRSRGCGCPVCAGRALWTGENDLETLFPELAAQWDAEKNAPLTPRDVAAYTNKRAWWRCEKGHSWCASINSRSRGCGCPVCAGRVVQTGENDLETLFPEIAAQWDIAKNAPLTPQNVTAYSNKKVWWCCEKGHSYCSEINMRTARHTDCPYCSDRIALAGFNDVATLRPDLAAEWDRENNKLTPRDVVPGSTRKVWWHCERGHKWQATVFSRARGSGCPVCAGRMLWQGFNDLETCVPDIAAQWDSEKNAPLLPSQVLSKAKQKVWWRCPVGHSYYAEIEKRVRDRTGCPYCAGRKVLVGFNDLATLRPKVAAQWHPTLNGTLTPQMVTAGVNRVVWWICDKGHVWKARIANRSRGEGNCPVCNGTAPRKQHIRYEAIMQLAAQREKPNDNGNQRP